MRCTKGEEEFSEVGAKENGSKVTVVILRKSDRLTDERESQLDGTRR
jgi:hypothetical protein